MGGNDLKGSIPDTLGKLMKLQKLTMNSSNLMGSIPVTLCNLGRLFELNLEKNQLSRQLPGCLGNISSLRRIYLEIGSVKGMQMLNLSGNQFSSDIPNSIGQHENLENLITSRNKFHGSIPKSLSELVALQYLDLSHNNLFGVIPKSLETLKNILYLNISYNELSGEIPKEGIFKNLTASSFKGNRELCGASQFEVMQCKANTTRSSSKTKVLKYVLPSIALVIILAIIMIWLITRCNRNTTLISQSSSLNTIKRISNEDILKSTNNFDDESLIGRGSIGSIYKGIFSDGMIAAIKAMDVDLVDGVEENIEAKERCFISIMRLVLECTSDLPEERLSMEYVLIRIKKIKMEFLSDVAEE
ncbi:probable LRR receptor-like serine threonine-kinase At3g47570 [Olea europaea subsp. europaea]|uniref:Probable LRR receptor-like serine threonine-kinase At3g47570 n=1 Tax=Olea europaea subsp. europaea TaxID=158383 RepID=A0A8S0RXH7_OLEEU|nr:probable LRR receptor-like serine threonine-kinase At3g47570 [Olea europaea subsp. europaea]